MKEVPNGVPVVTAGTGAGWPLVRGRCPSCGAASLFLASGGYVTCGIIRCPNPTAVSDALLDEPSASPVGPYWEAGEKQ